MPHPRSGALAALPIAATLLATAAGSVMAVTVTAVTAECFTDEQGAVTISGTITVAEPDVGDEIVLQLEGRTGNSGYGAIPGYTDLVTLAAGQTSAEYVIEITGMPADYTNLRIASRGSTSLEKSRSFSRGECSIVIPEVPFVGMLAVSGLLVAAASAVYTSRRSSRLVNPA